MEAYRTIDLVKANIEDCFVKRNKMGMGHGEARLYVGSVKHKNWLDFFDGFKLKCFFDKQNLKEYLESVKFEYQNPSQSYKRDIAADWYEYTEELSSFPNTIYFSVDENNDTNNMIGVKRYYIKSDDDVYDFFRRIALPNITSVLIHKILIGSETQLWFRIYLRDVGEELDKPIINEIINQHIEQIERDNTITETERERVILARLGQGYYRNLIVEKYKLCIITGIDDERLLVASHIKPWVSSTNSERISGENGLLLSPTYDKLFDRGFISFKNSGEIILSNFFSDANFKRVRLSKGDKFDLKITEEMKVFLEYHHDMVLKK